MILKYRSQLINFFLLCFQTMQRWNPVFFPVIFQLFFLPPPFMTWSNILRRQGKCRKIWKWYQNSGGMIYMTRKKHIINQNRNLVFFFDRTWFFQIPFENPVLFNPFICIIFLELGTCIAVGLKYFLSVSFIFKDRWKIYPSWLCLFWGIKVRL